MRSSLALLGLLLISCGPTWEQQPVIVTATGQRLCVAHHVPLVTVHGFQAPADYVSPCAQDPNCKQYMILPVPNRIPDDQSLTRTPLCRIPAHITYCPKCQQEFEVARRIII
jgi:hypothetical protein